MKTADMLLQTEHVGKWLDGRDVVFVGDGDAIGLCLVHLHSRGLLPYGPNRVHILDFDERIALSVQRFAKRFGITDRVTAELYNVADPLPQEHWQSFDGFYTNPPFGASNEGRSVEAFLRRAFEATGDDAVGCIVVADHPGYPWTRDVLVSTQRLVMRAGFMVSELLPEFHHYHLDDAPDLTSCSLVVRRVDFHAEGYNSTPLEDQMVANFYGRKAPMVARYIIDQTNGGKLPSRDYILLPLGAEGSKTE